MCNHLVNTFLTSRLFIRFKKNEATATKYTLIDLKHVKLNSRLSKHVIFT